MDKLLEIACFNLDSALIAQASGADRIELCENYSLGGITPTPSIILQAKKQITIPIHVIIRPRGGNFLYKESEISEMKKNILFCKENKVNGIVFGVLNSQNEIDLKICKELISLAKPMSVTFHRAIDSCHNIERSIEQLIELGVDRVLTSGGKGNCIDNLSTLKDLQAKLGTKIKIMPGGGIRSTNISEIAKITNTNEFHSAALLKGEAIANENEIKLMKQLISK